MWIGLYSTTYSASCRASVLWIGCPRPCRLITPGVKSIGPASMRVKIRVVRDPADSADCPTH
jgi:hypothetical protein